MSSCGCASSESYPLGSTPVITFTFVDVEGADADPDTLSIRVLHPDGSTVTTYDQGDAEVDNPAVGTWTWTPATYPAEPGVWWVYALASGGGVDRAVEVSFTIGDIHVPLG